MKKSNSIIDSDLVYLWHKTGAWRTMTIEQFLEYLKQNIKLDNKVINSLIL